MPSTPPNSSAPQAPLTPPNPANQGSRERLRFTDFRFDRTPSGRSSATVQLEWIEGDPIMGKASGQTSELGDLRIACEAALRAIESFAKGAFTLELLGVKLIRAFDSNVIIVAISAKRPEGATRLLGCTLAERDPLHGSIIAVLHATNRLLGNLIATR
jgi:hypothetical protein